MSQGKETPLASALAELEQEGTQPVVPGELASWCRDVGAKLAAMRDAWREASRRWREETERILEKDTALAARVDELRRKEAALGDELDDASSRAKGLLAGDLEDPTASEESLGGAERLRKDLLAWIVGARALDAEVETWFLEADYRDRGVGD